MKFVRIKTDLKVKKESDTPGVTTDMVALAGRLTKVIKIDVDGTFYLDVDNGAHCWTPDMVQEVTDDKLQYLKEVIKDIICNLECIDQNEENPQVDSYVDYSLKLAREALK